jgi:hypothetical protein
MEKERRDGPKSTFKIDEAVGRFVDRLHSPT